MAILEEKKFEGNGMVKELEESAIGLVLQNLQQDQYQYPIKSYIREVVSNCVDAVAEKHVARRILKGVDKVEDHFAATESALTKDSKFDESYYSLDHLSEDDTITITYLKRSGNRDQVIIKDRGVGLGGQRLRGYFKPAYSSKRLNKQALGKFGIGAKSGLSTGVESYQMVSCYNGRRYAFDIYNDIFHSTVPKFDMETSTENPKEVWKAKRKAEDGTIVDFEYDVHYTETEETNSVTVFIDVKNPIRNRTRFIEAVQSQLTYFENVELIELDEEDDEFREEHKVMSAILFQNEHMIIPSDTYYTVPHLVLNNVNYGPIDFGEMEMQKILGNVGIIGQPSEIDVNQSRESVRYTDKTRDAIKGYLDNAAVVGQDYVASRFEASSKDFLNWMADCKSLKSSVVGDSQEDPVLARLAKFADLSKIEMQFGDTGITFGERSFSKIFKGFRINKILVTKTDHGYVRTNSEEVKTFGDFSCNNLIYRASVEEKTVAAKMAYISEEILPKSANVLYTITPVDTDNNLFKESDDVLFDYQELIIGHVLDSARGLDLRDVDVPQEFLDGLEEAKKLQETADKEQEEKDEAKRIENAMTMEDIRKRDGKFIYHQLRVNNYNTHFHGTVYERLIKIDDSYLSKKKSEMCLEDVHEHFNKSTTIYGTAEDLSLIKAMLHMASYVDRERDYNGSALVNKYIVGGAEGQGLKFIVVSKNVAKFIDNHATHCKEAIQSFNSKKELVIMSKIRDYYTAKMFESEIRSLDYRFLQLFDEVDREAKTVLNELISFSSCNSFTNKLTNTTEGTTEIEKYLDNVAELQLYVNDNIGNVQNIAAKAKELLGSDQITGAHAINMEVYAKYKALQDYTEKLKPLLKGLGYGYEYGRSDVESWLDVEAIKEFIKFKNVPTFTEFLEERYQEFNVVLKDDTPEENQ